MQVVQLVPQELLPPAAAVSVSTESALPPPATTVLSTPSTASTATVASTATLQSAPCGSRPRKRRYPAKMAAVKSSAAETIMEAAVTQKAYYEAKLNMAKEKHEANMRILALKEQLLQKQIEE